MKKLLLFIPLMFLFEACNRPDIYVVPKDFQSMDGTPKQNALAEAYVNELYKFIEVDISTVDLHFFTSAQDQISTCPGAADCTIPHPNEYSVNIYWPEVNWVTENAYSLGHELCHVYYLQTHEDGDPNHTHNECFGRPDANVSNPAAYGGGEGFAWQAAAEIYAAYGP